MSNELFVLALGVGAALLAVWIHARYPGLAPERMRKTLIHVGAAFVLVKLTPSLGASSWTVFAGVFLLVLPVLVYLLLCTLWMLKHAQAMLGVSR